jgi:hypothetical protein
MNSKFDPNIFNSRTIPEYGDRDFVSFRPRYEKEIPRANTSKEFIDRKYPNYEMDYELDHSNSSLENFRRNKVIIVIFIILPFRISDRV